MKRLRTSELLKKLANYTFFDWESNNNDKFVCHFGMPKKLLKDVNCIDFYDSWGYEAVRDPYAKPPFSPKQWLMFEEMFFCWLKLAENILFPTSKVIVTPELTNWWFLYDTDPPEWNSKVRWQKPDYDNYISLLNTSGVISSDTPSLNDNFRGAEIENFTEFQIIAKIAVKNKPLLFFSNGDRVIRVTEYLSVIIESNSLDTHNKITKDLLNSIEPYFLENTCTE